MGLINFGNFQLHSGKTSDFKIDCDFLTDDDLFGIANILRARLPRYGPVVGIPNGGLRLAARLRWYGHPEEATLPVLIVDDVLTTGHSMEETRSRATQILGRPAIGVVIFSRGVCPDWIVPLFQVMIGDTKNGG